MNDLHALHLARRAVGNLNLVKRPDISLAVPEEPLYPADDIYGIVGDNVKKNYDIREVKINQVAYQILFYIFYILYLFVTCCLLF